MRRRIAALALLAAASSPALAQDRLLDDFSDAAAWKAGASEDVGATAVPGRRGLCLRYDFGAVSGYAVLRRELPFELPPHYAFVLRLSGSGLANTLQFKLVDDGGDNVWWLNRPGYRPPAAGEDLTIRQRQISFAWGPTADRTLRRVAAIELVVARGEGGAGELCFEQLALRTLEPPRPLPAAEPWPGGRSWQRDLGVPTEIAGLLLRWPAGAPAHGFDVALSDDGRRWRTERRVRGAMRETMAVLLPEREARHVRVRAVGSPGYAPVEIRLVGPEEWPDANAMLRTLASASPRGAMPRAYLGEQNYWTIVGVDGGGKRAALISEDGAIEPSRGGPSLEPALIDEAGGVIRWADVQITPSLRDGYLPLPMVRWTAPDFTLAIEAGADGPPDAPRLLARYRLTNTGDRPRRWTLALALRPWQVNPPTQFLNTPGGHAPIRRIAWNGGNLEVDGRRWLRPLDATPDRVTMAAFDRADALAAPVRHLLVDDENALASAALRWRLPLAPGESREITIEWPPVGAGAMQRPDPRPAGQRLDAIADAWRARLNRVRFALPPQAQPIADTLRSSLAQILVSRDGPALQPGTRSYARAWIRDGAMMVAGLLRLGEVDAARDFVRWYAGHLFANGKVPCCVDSRGADPVAENDSPGQLLFAIAELWRHTGDRALAEALWPAADAAAHYMESLRQSERRPGNEGPFFGMMPASISHEGYSAKPVHSYWDDFWALAGYRAAVALAKDLGRPERAAELAAQGAQFEADLAASLRLTVAAHRIDFLPGAAELGDYDPSSSTMIFSPAGAESLVPRTLLDSTWERYWRESVERSEGRRDWVDYTPYELRSVSAFIRLGQPERAHALLDFFLRDRRPAAWNQWAEVVGRLPREPRFVGDMPHAWISSDFIRSALDLLAYERPSDDALVIAAGVPAAWWQDTPVAVDGLRTAHGVLSYRIAAVDGGTKLTVQPGVRPPGGLWWQWAGPGAPPRATSEGRTIGWQGALLPLPSAGDAAIEVVLQR